MNQMVKHRKPEVDFDLNLAEDMGDKYFARDWLRIKGATEEEVQKVIDYCGDRKATPCECNPYLGSST